VTVEPRVGRASALREITERYRLAKAQQEESKLKRMRGETVDLAVVKRRTFGFFRLIRKRLDDWVARAAPIIAAKAQADEGTVRRALSEEMRGLQFELSTLDLNRDLTELEAEDSADERGDGPGTVLGLRSRVANAVTGDRIRYRVLTAGQVSASVSMKTGCPPATRDRFAGTVPGSSDGGPPLRREDSPMEAYVGLDAHSKRSVFVIANAQGAVIGRGDVPSFSVFLFGFRCAR
jgi:hypothetical protein